MSPTMSRSSRALGAAVAALLLLASCDVPSGEEPSGEGTGSAAPPTATAAESPTGSEPATESPSPAPTSPTATPSGTPGGSPSGTPTATPSGTPGGSPSGTPTATPSGTPTGTPSPAPVELVTYSGTAADAAFAFELPATWRVDGEFSDVGGTVPVLGPDGDPVGHLSVLIAWGAECVPGCPMPPVTHLGDVPGSVPLSGSGEFVVRSVAMDLTSAPELRNANGWPQAVRLVTSLTDADEPPPTRMLPAVLYGLGMVETGVVAPNGVTYRTVIFSSVHDFPTLEDAQAYAGTEEHRQVEAMIASFRA